MYILGINSAYHESAACLLRDAHLVAAAEEERFTRIKHAKRPTVNNPDELPLNAITFCLEKAGLSSEQGLELSEISHIGFSLDPEKRYTSNIQHGHPYALDPADFGGLNGERIFYSKLMSVPRKLRALGFNGEFHFLNHHICHAASVFYPTPFQKAAVAVTDGIGEFATTTLYRGCDNSLDVISESSYPNSLGFLWEKVSEYLGFSEYDGAKIMALAAFGDPAVYRDAFAKIVDDAGHFQVDDSIVRYRSKDFGPLSALFGLEKRSMPISTVGRCERRYADVAAALQEVTDRFLLDLACKAKDIDQRNLCLSGGVALNCAAVGKILRAGLFEQVYVPCAAHDAGTAIGAAFHIAHGVRGLKRAESSLSPYLGPEFTDEDIESVLITSGVVGDNSAEFSLEERVAELIAGGAIVGWFQGRMEFGPRALGNRSLLADPRRLQSIEKLGRIKHRLPFDPFAPCILREDLNSWFEMPPTHNLSEHYMVASYSVLEAKRAEIPAVIHVDGTSRVQAVNARYNPRLHRVLKAFKALTGVPILLNTSFNDQEPIVCSPQDALNTALRCGVDYLVLGDSIVRVDPTLLIPELPLEVYFEKLR